jgi:S-adenosylmethionine hydrolase
VFNWTLAGEIVTPTWLPEVMVTVVDPTAAGVNREAAVITTEAGLGIAVGAV